MKIYVVLSLLCLSCGILSACNTSSTTENQSESNGNGVVVEKNSNIEKDKAEEEASSENPSAPAADTPKVETKIITVSREGMEEKVHAQLYKSHAQPINFFVFDGYNVKMGAENQDFISFTSNDRSYMTLKKLSSAEFAAFESNLDKDKTLRKNIMSYDGLEKAFVYFSEPEDGVSISTILFPGEGDRPNLLAVIHNPLEMENYDMYYEMLKTVVNQ
ncbi:hypothetical protein [Falsibacillus pallidus]|uniref:Lipoprotein n=1 Tax=Falsibacillus pallidus TaxID=493781 RepID=A0A370GPA8_9BACI|nr:hypothetical protein [Falsibacillus pallidus]RDI45568.1 hypothetical protein DFR59_102196 [Falsibacillus pallidus]